MCTYVCHHTVKTVVYSIRCREESRPFYERRGQGSTLNLEDLREGVGRIGAPYAPISGDVNVGQQTWPNQPSRAEACRKEDSGGAANATVKRDVSDVGTCRDNPDYHEVGSPPTSTLKKCTMRTVDCMH